MKKFKFFRYTLLSFSLVLIFSGSCAYAQERSYSYDLIHQEIQINKDSTIDVTETEKFNFIGEYHQGYRTILKQRIGPITDITVTDGQTGRPLTEVSHALNKTDPASFGRYTVSDSGDAKNIEWYFDAKDTTHEWIIHYKVHGALSFLADHDELYWNLLTGFSVPIQSATATVHLPESTDIAKLQAHGYALNSQSIERAESISGNEFQFTFKNLAPGEEATIAAGFPKGIVPQSAYYIDFAKTYGGILLSILLVLGVLIWRLLFWYYKEKKPEGERTIVVEYEPPQNIRPAMASLVLNEGVSSKAWSATVVDLAVRGYVRIEEEPPSKSEKFFRIIYVIFAIFIPALGLGFVLLHGASSTVLGVFVFLGITLFIQVLRGKNIKAKLFATTSYILTRTEKALDETVEAYEKDFLSTLFAEGRTRFSFSEMRQASNTEKRALYMKMQALEKSLAEETDTDTKGYEVSIGAFTKKRVAVLGVGIVALLAITHAVGPLFGLNAAIICGAVLVSAWVIYSGVNNPRLNAEGRELKRKLLGFKLYLETAERYRMQNLTPETFEKYLPYAILFGVEKKWASAFSSITLSPPSWYAGAYAGGISNSTTGGGFQAGAFASGFSASFASSFASTGGSGASGGGGGAGGGGGGGGGGAS
jgi:hypothetical protein